MLDVGFKNYIDEKRIISVIKPNSSRARWIIKEAVAGRKLINCTHGKKTSSIIILKTNHLVLSALKSSTLEKKLEDIKIKNG